MALLAGLREPRLHVVGVGGAIEIGEVAGDAGRAFQVVGPGGTELGVVTLGALQSRVRPGQGKPGRRVIKRRSVPGRCVVALLARRGKPGLHVVRVGCAVEILDVA